jgi:hypothetical protein
VHNFRSPYVITASFRALLACFSGVVIYTDPMALGEAADVLVDERASLRLVRQSPALSL